QEARDRVIEINREVRKLEETGFLDEAGEQQYTDAEWDQNLNDRATLLKDMKDQEELIANYNRSLARAEEVMDSIHNEMVDETFIELYGDRYDETAQTLYDKNFADLTEGQRTQVQNLIDRTLENLEGEGFKSTHYDDMDIIAHTRWNDRTGPNGEKILFIEEWQSDWYLEGTQKGWAGPDNKNKLILQARYEELMSSFRSFEQEMVTKYDVSSVDELKEVIDQGDWNDYQTIKAEANRAGQAWNQAGEGVPQAPFVTAGKWYEPIFKRMLRYAAENGYDQMAWTTGQTQIDRYNLSRWVTEIGWARRADGNMDVTVYMKQGGTQVYNNQTPEQLSGIVGAEVTKKIVEANPTIDKITSATDEYNSFYLEMQEKYGEGWMTSGKANAYEINRRESLYYAVQEARSVAVPGATAATELPTGYDVVQRMQGGDTEMMWYVIDEQGA
ncbi:unnamed protein product, partial [marine sediment metagenome]